MIQPAIKWSGSKRSQAYKIAEFAPKEYGEYYEPFVGGGSVMYAMNPRHGICADKCEPLIGIWKMIQKNPCELADYYEMKWEMLQELGQEVYYNTRAAFNQYHRPEDLLFITRTCTNGLIRFNQDGEFNNSFHITRPGIRPDKLRDILFDWQARIKNITFDSGDYHETTEDAKEGDFIYLDPPYFHTKGQYYGGIDYSVLLEYLDNLNRRGIKYILSYDGVQGSSSNIVNIPKKLYRRHEMIYSGNSSFKRVIGKENVDVYESLYMNW